jgi:two-component sensor histidine kinase
VLEFFQRLFRDDFVPRFQCVNERDDLLWLHVTSDALIAIAYYSIPLALLYFVRRRRDVEFNWMYLMFAAFIVACGTTHVISVAAFWHPMYRLDGVVKAATAGVSVLTAILLWPLIPAAIALPSPSQLAKANEELAREVNDRRRAQEDLRRARDELETRVTERTATLEAEVARRKLGEEHRSLLMAELDHRVKNNLATVLSIAEQTLRMSSSLDEFRGAFVGRVTALARTHAALARGQWQGASLDSLVGQVLAPYATQDRANIIAQGPPVTLGARLAPPITMALHELATNAAKYGAFSSATGVLTVRWRVADDTLELVWEERGGPATRPPARRGLGTVIIDGAVRYELGGTVDTTYAPEGVRVTLHVPLRPASLPIPPYLQEPLAPDAGAHP